MIISQVKLPIDHTHEDMLKKLRSISGKKIADFKIKKKSTDARKGDICFVYTVDAVTENEEFEKEERISVKQISMKKRPVIVGSGPAGLFCGYFLALAGCRPIILERGQDVDTRQKDVDNFRTNRILNPSSNVQFGEGGAGTFSDGKLTTQIKNPLCREVLSTFADFGAPEEITYLAKPHIGTDKLIYVIKNMRLKICELGGQFKFGEAMCDFTVKDGSISSVTGENSYETDHLILAVGHSARDTYQLLFDKGLNMIAKPFSLGARIEHPQSLINASQYGDFADSPYLGAASYKLAYHTKSGRGVYTFCMCPGGVVIAAASEPDTVVTNGMSYHARDGKNANSALLVGITPDDFPSKHPLAGIDFQRELERKAFIAGGSNYNAPCQTVGDFLSKRPSTGFGSVNPSYTPNVTPSDLREVLPSYICDAMAEAIPALDKKLKGFTLPDALLTAVESRSSAPVRLIRDENMLSNIGGIYPIGEGAGYAGGIVSSAVDGIKCALTIIDGCNK